MFPERIFFCNVLICHVYLCRMNIGFDAKRAFHNSTGLGFFNRVLVKLLATHFPQHEYYLFNPKPGNLFTNNLPNVHEVLPQNKIHKVLKSAWRSKWVVKDLEKLGIDIYHGPSHEIPIGIDGSGVASVVTIHDLFPEIYPEQYKPIDVKIYRSKSRYACKHANRIMAISEETKHHIIDIYKTDPEKIDVIYQSCDPIFTVIETADKKEAVRKKYGLPKEFFLHVGTIIERKNLLNICKAINEIRKEIDLPLVVVGKGGKYKEQVKQYIKEVGLQSKIIFLSDDLAAQGKKAFIETEDFPSLYQLATAMIYPSYYEGFGMPIIEAMAGGVPVITSTTSCLPEISGPAAFLANPDKPEEMAEGMRKIYFDKEYVSNMKERGFEHVKKFMPEIYVDDVMKMYKKAMSLPV